MLSGVYVFVFFTRLFKPYNDIHYSDFDFFFVSLLRIYINGQSFSVVS